MFLKSLLTLLAYATAFVVWGVIIVVIGTAIIVWVCRTEQEDEDAKQERKRRRLSIKEFLKRVFMTKTEREIYCYFGISKQMQRKARKEGYIDLDGMLKAYKCRIEENRAWREANKDLYDEVDELAKAIEKAHGKQEGRHWFEQKSTGEEV